MRIQDLIDAIDMSELSSRHVSFDRFADDLRIAHYSFDWKEDVWDLFAERVKAVPIYTWYCTDTTVGIFAFFLDSELVCLSFQAGRKLDENFYWLSKEAAKSVSDFIETLKDENTDIWISLLSDFSEETYWDWGAVERELYERKGGANYPSHT